MRMKFLPVLLFCLFCMTNINLSAQKAKVPKNPMKWGKIPKADLEMTSYEQDPEAAAVVLGEYGNVEYYSEYGYVKYRYQLHVRIKILKTSALKEYSNFELRYREDDLLKLKFIKAQSFTPDGTKQKISSKNKFIEKEDAVNRLMKVTIPGVKVGSVIEYKYTLESFASSRIPTWYFQQRIPVRMSRLNVAVVQGVQFIYDLQGRSYLDRIGEGSYTYMGSSKLDIIEGRNFTMTNVPAINVEKFITTLRDYWLGVSFYLESNDLGLRKRVFLKDWDDFAEKYRAAEGFGEEYTSKKNYIELVKASAPIFNNNDLTQKEKVEGFYKFINEKVKWNHFYSTFSSGLNDAFKEKEASSGELNLMLLALLREAKIKAYPVLISTRGHGKAMESYPLGRQFNHVLVCVELADETLFLDAREELRPMGYPAVNSLNKRGWMLRDTSHAWIDIPAKKGTSVYLVEANLSEDGNLSGTMQSAYNGYDALKRRNLFKEKKSTEAWKEDLAAKHPEITIESIAFENEEKLSALFKNEINWQIPNAAQVSGNLMYISPVFYSLFSENYLKQEKRIYPVDFPFPFKEQLVVNMKLPKGYMVDGLPEPVNLSLPNKGGQFQYFIKEKDGSLQLVSKLMINQLFFEPQEYAGLKKLFDLVVEKHGEQLVLKKMD